MLLSHSKKFITIDIPKTATRSLRETLNDSGFVDLVGSHTGPRQGIWQHSKARYVKNVINNKGFDWDSYYKYTVVRNPWDRLVSWMNYSLEYTRQNKLKTKEEFCSLLKQNADYTTQEDYITDEYGDVIVDQVSNFDNLQEGFDVFCDNVNIEKKKLKHSNLSKKEYSKENLFNQESIDIIYEREKFIIDMMSYTF